MLCQIFKSTRREAMYLYVEKTVGLSRVPASLLQRFGEPEAVMMLMLDASKSLARADAGQVMADISNQGFYLQMPPGVQDD